MLGLKRKQWGSKTAGVRFPSYTCKVMVLVAAKVATKRMAFHSWMVIGVATPSRSTPQKVSNDLLEFLKRNY